MQRRDFLATVGAVTGAWASGAVHAQSSAAALRLVVPYPPGGFTDVVSRMVGERLQTALSRTVVAENRPGAGTNLAAEHVSRAAPDGNTVLMGTSSLAINASLYKKLGYAAMTDLRPLGVFASTGYALLASKALAANTLPELIAQAKAQPDKLSYGSSGNGAVNHLAGELFKSMSGTSLLHVPYKGSQAALTDLVGGRIDLYWSSILEAQPLLAADRVKVLGLTNLQRSQALPTVPLMGDTVKGYDVEFWMGLFVPAGTPATATAAVEQALRGIATDPAFAAEMTRRGAQARYADAAAAKTLLAQETSRWAEVVKSSGAAVD